jgi:dihydroneopterin aldolase
MKTQAFVELFDLRLSTEIGTYNIIDTKPDDHLLNLLLEIDTKKVLIHKDEMHSVFDYDPLINEIDRLAGFCKYETEEYLLTRIACACASYLEIKTIDISLRKMPVRDGNGSLGVRLTLNEADTHALRSHEKTDF